MDGDSRKSKPVTCTSMQLGRNGQPRPGVASYPTPQQVMVLKRSVNLNDGGLGTPEYFWYCPDHMQVGFPSR